MSDEAHKLEIRVYRLHSAKEKLRQVTAELESVQRRFAAAEAMVERRQRELLAEVDDRSNQEDR